MKAIAALQYFITGVKFCLAKHTQNVSINLQEAFMFICMQKVHLINIFFFFKILQKYQQLPILGTLDMSGTFYQKR